MAVAPAPRAPQTSAAVQAVSRNISEWNATLIRARRPLPFPNTSERGPKSDGFYFESISEEHITTHLNTFQTAFSLHPVCPINDAQNLNSR
jgi:hypothetical protein